jgi:hypothetical protein
MSDCWILDAGYLILDAEYWVLVTGMPWFGAQGAWQTAKK